MGYRTWTGPLLLAALAALPARRAEGQLPDASAAALGMGDTHAALARGFTAVARNPAGLAMPDGPEASASIFSIRGVGGLGPVDLGDFAAYEGELLSEEVRRQWLDRITTAGGEEGTASAEVSYLSAQYGRFGLQFASRGDVDSSLSPGAAELLLFGNAGRTGAPADIALQGSAFDLAVTSTFGVGYAHPLIREGDRALSLGVTLKYTIGHLMMTALELGGETTADPLAMRVEFPVVQSDTIPGLGGPDTGAGVGLDVGLAWRDGPLLAGLVLRDLVNTFAWNEESLYFRAGTVTVEGETRATDFEPRPFSDAPDPVRERVRELHDPPVLAAGMAYEPRSDLTLSAELRQRLGEGRSSLPDTRFGAGAEYRPLAWLPLRAGASLHAEGYLLAGGLGLHLGPLHLDAALASRKSGSAGMVSVAVVRGR
jgi:hypothetical protein